MKTLIPLKLILSSDGNGNVTNAIFQYKITISGVTNGNVYSLPVLTSLGNSNLSALFTAAIVQAKTTEGIT